MPVPQVIVILNIGFSECFHWCLCIKLRFGWNVSIEFLLRSLQGEDEFLCEAHEGGGDDRREDEQPTVDVKGHELSSPLRRCNRDEVQT